MRKTFTSLALALSVLGGLVTQSQSASASWEWEATQNTSQQANTDHAARQAGPIPIPSTLLSSNKFWPYTTITQLHVCVANGDNAAPIAKMAQAWNNATGSLALDYSSNCIADGYAPSMRMTVDTYSNPDGRCVRLSNTYGSVADSFYRWTGNPANVVAWVNRYYSTCWGSSLLRDKWTAIAIGEALGANLLTGDQWNGRGMSASSQLYGPSASTDGVSIDNLYNEFYEGIYG